MTSTRRPGSSAPYSFVSRWHVPAEAERAWNEIERMLVPGVDLSWWPGVAVEMAPRRLEPGERAVMSVRSPLGYRLRMLLELTRIEHGRLIQAASDGDLQGSGSVEVASVGAEASVISFHWHVIMRRRWMIATGWLLRPIFSWAHAVVMRRGERGLRALLSR